LQGYNAQIAVDSDSQVLVAQMLMREQNDAQALGPMLRFITARNFRQAHELSADTGYCSEDACGSWPGITSAATSGCSHGDKRGADDAARTTRGPTARDRGGGDPWLARSRSNQSSPSESFGRRPIGSEGPDANRAASTCHGEAPPS